MARRTTRQRPDDPIVVVGARENNLKDVSVTVPKLALTAFTGVSGSGKSSLVFDTIAAESQRQLNETYSAFIRNRLPHLGKPDVDALENLSVAIAIDQKPFGGNARSTVGTATDIAPMLRLVFSRVGEPFVGYSNVFSFNDLSGMCPECEGLGTVSAIDADQLVDRSLSLNDGAIRFPTFRPGTAYWKRYVDSGLFDNDQKVRDFSKRRLGLLFDAEPRALKDAPPRWYKSAKFEGVLPRFRRMYLAKDAEKTRRKYGADFDRIVTQATCPLCHGDRLNQRSLSSRIHGRNIAELSRLPIVELAPVIERITQKSVAPVVAAISRALDDLRTIGLGYLSLDRISSTLSGGEAQRVKMVRHLGSSLTNLTYILDEPTIGLHPRDVHRLTELLAELRDKGNTILVVEHDPGLIEVADHIIDVGPDAGTGGGSVVFEGSLAGLRRASTPTGRYLRSRKSLVAHPRVPRGDGIRIEHATRNNLRDVSVTVPTGVLTVVTGVAGSGKSSLINGELRTQHDDIVFIDQSAIRGSRRSTPATFLGILDPIRRLFAEANGVGVEWFSSNSKGACSVCHGLGVIVTDLAFMDDVEVVCDACGGARFNPTALGYRFNGRSIHDVLVTTVADAVDLFDDARVSGAIERMIRTGLGYITIGQSLDSLSGGERQRLKLARELAEPSSVYVFDEPTTGLHGRDVAHLLELFDDMVDGGATLIVIEHNLDVMAHADWIIDVGPGAGTEGGTITFEGTAADLIQTEGNVTGEYLRAYV